MSSPCQRGRRSIVNDGKYRLVTDRQSLNSVTPPSAEYTCTVCFSGSINQTSKVPLAMYSRHFSCCRRRSLCDLTSTAKSGENGGNSLRTAFGNDRIRSLFTQEVSGESFAPLGSSGKWCSSRKLRRFRPPLPSSLTAQVLRRFDGRSLLRPLT